MSELLGPLPTTFSVPTSIWDSVYKMETTPAGYYYLLQGAEEQTEYFPSGYTAHTEQYYSPAICPTGFTSACVSTNHAGTVTETVVTCCPTVSKFGCQTNPSYAWESTLGCTVAVEDISTVWTVYPVTDGETSTDTSTGNEGGLNAYSIQVRHQSTDFTTTTSSSSSSSTSSATPTSTSSNGLSPTGSNNSNVSHSKGGLSAGAAAGIAVGAVVILLLVIAGAWLMIRRRRKQEGNGGPIPPPESSPMQQQQYPHMASVGTPVSWASGTPAPQSQYGHQQYYDPPKGAASGQTSFVYEMGAHDNAVEMDANAAASMQRHHS